MRRPVGRIELSDESRRVYVHYQPASQRCQGCFDLSDMRAVVQVQQPPHGTLTDSEPPSELHVAMDYIRDHEAQVSIEYEKILVRIKKGNPAQVEAQLRANREKIRSRLSGHQTTSH